MRQQRCNACLIAYVFFFLNPVDRIEKRNAASSFKPSTRELVAQASCRIRKFILELCSSGETAELQSVHSSYVL